MNMKELTAGSEVWYIEPFSETVIKVKVTGEEKGVIVIEVLSEDSALKGCTLRALPDSLFDYEQKAIDERTRRHEDALSCYLAEIKDVPSLIDFCLHNCIGGSEDTDYIARKAVITKAKEFGIQINTEN